MPTPLLYKVITRRFCEPQILISAHNTGNRHSTGIILLDAYQQHPKAFWGTSLHLSIWQQSPISLGEFILVHLDGLATKNPCALKAEPWTLSKLGQLDSLSWEWVGKMQDQKKTSELIFSGYGALRMLTANSCYTDPGHLRLCSWKHFYFLPGYIQNNIRSDPGHCQTWPLGRRTRPSLCSWVQRSLIQRSQTTRKASSLHRHLEGSYRERLLTHIWLQQDEALSSVVAGHWDLGVFLQKLTSVTLRYYPPQGLIFQPSFQFWDPSSEFFSCSR